MLVSSVRDILSNSIDNVSKISCTFTSTNNISGSNSYKITYIIGRVDQEISIICCCTNSSSATRTNSCCNNSSQRINSWSYIRTRIRISVKSSYWICSNSKISRIKLIGNSFLHVISSTLKHIIRFCGFSG